MSKQLRYRKDGNKMLGAGDYMVDHDHGGSIIYTGLYQGDDIVALLVGRNKDATPEHIQEIGDRIVRACNAHEQLVEALQLLLREEEAGTVSEIDRQTARAALAAAGAA